jgi:hypothetical protein
MPLVVPMFAAPGVPSSRPVEAQKVAQAGRLVMLNVSVPPLASLALGVNEYCVPAVAVVGGAPVMVGALLGGGLLGGGALGGALTAIENAGN